MKYRFAIIILIIVYSSFLFADQIIFVRGKHIDGVITAVSDTSVEYVDNQSQSVQSVNRDEVDRIVYSNGKVVQISDYNSLIKLLSRLYFGIGLGSGRGGWSFSDSSKSFSIGKQKVIGVDDDLCYSMNLGAGYVIDPIYHIGIELNFIDGYKDSLSEKLIYNWMIMTTFLPFEKGFLVKCGAGYSGIQLQDESLNGKYYSESGAGFLAGVGYAFELKDSNFLCLNFDCSYQAYRFMPSTISNSYYWSMYVSMYIY